MQTKVNGIQKIKYGEVHRFYPLKFKSEKSFEELCDLIQNSKVIFSDEYQNKVMDALGYSLSQIVKEMKKDFPENSMVIKMQDFDKYNALESAPTVTNSDNIRVEFEDTGSSIKINFVHMELEELQKQILQIQREEDRSSKIYGKKFVSFQNRFVLLPFKLELNNRENTWLDARLYVFANGMGVLKLKFPIINIGIEAFKQNDIDSLISKVINKWEDKNYVPEATLSSIADCYIKSLEEDTGIEFNLYGNDINYISFVDFEGMPKQIYNVPKEVQEDLFRIIAAPVPNRKSTSYVKDAQEYLKENSWGGHNINYIVKSTGGCLSYIDQALIDTISEEYKEQNSINCLDRVDYLNLCNNIATNVFINVEFALLIILLKKMNDCNCYYEKVNELGDLSKIQKEYNRNILFISELQEDCYGSVSEQTEFFEKRMCHYFKQEIMERKLIAIDSILRDEEKKKREEFQDFIAIGGLMLNIAIGLPAINDTIAVIREVFAFWPYNVPIITMENVILFLWLVFNGFILIKIVKERMLNKVL